MKIPEKLLFKISTTMVLSVLLLFLMFIITLIEPRFIRASNLMILMRQLSIIGLVSFGMICVILTSGIDLSGSVFALSGVCEAWFNTTLGMP